MKTCINQSAGNTYATYIMISVENFYWILYENLLKPCNLDCWLYYPFGTKNFLSKQGEYRQFSPRDEHHVLFHYDQEPIFEPNLGQAYDINTWSAWSTKCMKILANSEHSDLKKKLCRDRGMIDWYFFFHGFAALDWFQDSRYVTESAPIEKIFCSLNHLTVDQRAYRMALTARLFDLGIEKLGQISLNATVSQCQTEIDDVRSLLSSKDKSLIKQHLCESTHLPMAVDSTNVDGNFSARFGHQEYKLWQRSFLCVVNETVFYLKKLHLTEKVFKPIVCSRPFVLVASPGNLRYLRSYGFKTFSPWIDESYDDEIDNDRRLDMISLEIAKLCDKSLDQLRQILQDMRPVLDHNKKHFFGKFRQIIADELVDNFDSCIRRWNNTRLDGRELPLLANTSKVKYLLAN